MGQEWRRPDESAANFAKSNNMMDLTLADLEKLGQQTHWTAGPFLVFDTETTGIKETEDRIVTAALYLQIEGKRWQRSWLINSERPISGAAQKVNKISNEYLIEKGQNWQEALPEIANYLLTASRAGFKLVAYNAHFDFTILNNNLKELGEPDLFTQHPDLMVIDPYILDRGLDRFRKGKRKLVNLLEFYCPDLGPVELHNALMDCFYTEKVLTEILKSFPELPEWPNSQLMAKQRELYRIIQKNFQEYFRRIGRKENVNMNWI